MPIELQVKNMDFMGLKLVLTTLTIEIILEIKNITYLNELNILKMGIKR